MDGSEPIKSSTPWTKPTSLQGLEESNRVENFHNATRLGRVLINRWLGPTQFVLSDLST
jgi:hypothetical protein